MNYVETVNVQMYIGGLILKNITDYVLLYRIADAYYCQGQTQDQIARQENISRPHVSRLLTKARECGIVNIRVEYPEHVKQQCAPGYSMFIPAALPPLRAQRERLRNAGFYDCTELRVLDSFFE